jgi:hypothetical protein
MATYTIDIPGRGPLTIRADGDLSDDDIDSIVEEQTGRRSQSAGAEAGREASLTSSASSARTAASASAPTDPDQMSDLERQVLDLPPKPSSSLLGSVFDSSEGAWSKQFDRPDAGYLDRTSRRVYEAGEAALDIPRSALGIITGGDYGGFQGRGLSALRLLRGIASPISVLASPVEAGIESAASTVLPEGWSRFAGDLGGAVSTLGLGLLAKGGKLGSYGLQVAKAVGAARPSDIAEQYKHDPMLRYVLETKDEAEAGLEELARRGEYSMEQIALASKTPRLAEAALNIKREQNNRWAEWAKRDQIISDLPDEPVVKTGNLEFSHRPTRDLGWFGALGTPTNVLPRINPKAGEAAYDLAVTETKIRHAAEVRAARTARALTGQGDKQVAMAVQARAKGIKAEDLADTNPVKRILQFFENKFEVDRQIILPRLRQEARHSVEIDVKNALTSKFGVDRLTDELLNKEVDAALRKMFPDNMAVDDMMGHVFPGRYYIKDRLGNVLAEADTKMAAKFKVWELAKSNLLKPRDFKVQGVAYFDADTLSFYKDRVGKGMDTLARATQLTEDEVARAAAGDFGYKKVANFFSDWAQGKSTNFTRDVMKVLDIYDKKLEKWLQLRPVSQNVHQLTKNLKASGQTRTAHVLETMLNGLWGQRAAIGEMFDNTIRSIPGVNKLVSPFALERWVGGTKLGIVNVMLRMNPRYRLVNATQTAQTLWPVAETADIMEAIRLRNAPEGKSILSQYQLGSESKLAGLARKVGVEEKWNQEVAFLTMYNKARKLGLSDDQASKYAILRGNIYSQFMGLTVDQPHAFRKLDPLGLFTMFQRFPIKQYEQLFDLVRDRNFPGAGKWLVANLAMGGMRAATLGQGGWLPYKMYKEIEKEYGQGVADLIHSGLPSLVGVDLSNSVQIFNPPFGDTVGEKVVSQLQGPLFGLVSSVIGAASNSAGPEPSAIKRTFNALSQRVPLAKQAYSVVRLLQGDYDFRDPIGRLRYKAEVKDVVKSFLGMRSLRESEMDAYATALMEVKEKRDQVINYVASRHGQASLAGIDLGDAMREMLQKQVDGWNSMWPEFVISADEIKDRAVARQKAATTTLRERLLQGAPKAIRRSGVFDPQDPYSTPSPQSGFDLNQSQTPSAPSIPFGGG